MNSPAGAGPAPTDPFAARADLRLVEQTGSVDIYADGRRLTSARGVHGFLFGPGRDLLSTESPAGGPTSAAFEWRILGGPEAAGLRVTLHTEEPLEIWGAGVRLHLDPTYRSWSTGREAAVFPPDFGSPWQPCWQGVPPAGHVTLTAPLDELPPLRLEIEPTSRLASVKVTHTGPEIGVRVIEVFRYLADRRPFMIPPGDCLLLDARLRLRRPPTLPFIHPREMFAFGPVRRVMVLSQTDPACALAIAAEIRRRLPQVIEAGRAQSPEVTVTVGSDGAWARRAASLGLTAADAPLSPAAALHAGRARPAPDLVAVAVTATRGGFGLAGNLFAWRTGCRYKIKIDLAGNIDFQRADVFGTLVRLGRRLRRAVHRLQIKGSKGAVWIWVLATLPLLALRAAGRRRSGS